MNKTNAFILAMIASGPAGLYAWHITQATQFLYLLGLLEVFAIVVNGLALISMFLVIPKMEDDKFVDTMAEMKRGLENPLKYLSYPVTAGTMIAFLYFEHYTLFTLSIFSLLGAIAVRLCGKWAVAGAYEGGISGDTE